MYNPHTTAQKIRELCKVKSITAMQLAQNVGASRNILNKIDSGKILDINYFCDIAQFLSVGIEEIIQIDDGVEI